MGFRINMAAITILAVCCCISASMLIGRADVSEPHLVLSGKSLYYTAWGNSPYACIYCHANFDEKRWDDGYQRPAHSLWDSYNRPTYFNKAYSGPGETALIRAANTCIAGFLKAEPLPASDSKMTALIAYLRSISPSAKVEAITITRQTTLPELDGDPRRGENYYKASCTLCHRADGSAPELAYQAATSLAAVKIRGLQSPLGVAPEIVEWKAPMPFFSLERLSDQKAADILSYWEYRRFLAEQERAKARTENGQALDGGQESGPAIQSSEAR